LRQTWRWFGPNDPNSICDLLQAGVEGVVTALHDLPPGRVWATDEIAHRQAEVAYLQDGAKSGLSWEVVESLPVSEDIKRQSGNWRAHVDAYKESLTNLHAAGLKVICYNFMPVLDWTRTDLSHRLPTGATCMRFDLIDFVAFDIHILGRAGAKSDFPGDVVEAAGKRYAEMSSERRAELATNATPAPAKVIFDVEANCQMLSSVP